MVLYYKTMVKSHKSVIGSAQLLYKRCFWIEMRLLDEFLSNFMYLTVNKVLFI